MSSIDKANDLIYETLMSLIEFNNSDLSLKQKKELSEIIDDLEEVRHILFEMKNEIKSSVSQMNSYTQNIFIFK